jgi:putative endonuclease
VVEHTTENRGVESSILSLGILRIFSPQDKSQIMYYTYILKCNDESFYTGITWNLLKRIKEHDLGIGAEFTKSRLPVRLVYYQELNSKKEAAKREKEIKGWYRKKKENLIEVSKYYFFEVFTLSK